MRFLLKITLKHIFYLTSGLLLLEGLMSISFNYRLLSDASYSLATFWDLILVNLIMHGIVVGVLWLAFFLYVRYSLTRDILNKKSPDKSNKLITHLQTQIQHHLHEKDLMISALAHDIKTPLTEAFLSLELLDQPAITDKIKKKLERIHQIIQSSLDYARKPDQLKQTEIDLVSLLQVIVEDQTRPGFGISFETDLPYCSIPVELGLFKRMINNLLENAQKYATECHLRLTQPTLKQLELTLEDDGPGVPEKYLNLLGVPYFRVNQARTTSTGGTGLGLAIAKKIIELHQGEISFHNVEHGGLQIKIVFDLEALEKSKDLPLKSGITPPL